MSEKEVDRFMAKYGGMVRRAFYVSALHDRGIEDALVFLARVLQASGTRRGWGGPRGEQGGNGGASGEGVGLVRPRHCA